MAPSDKSLSLQKEEGVSRRKNVGVLPGQHDVTEMQKGGNRPQTESLVLNPHHQTAA